MIIDADKSLDVLSDFFATGKSRSFRRGDIVLNCSDLPTSAYWIRQGFVKVIAYNNSGDERLYYIYGPGEIFPIAGLFEQVIENQTFQAVNQVKLYVKTAQEFGEFVQENPAVMAVTMGQAIHFIERIYTLNLTPSDQRLRYALLLFAQRFGKKEEGHLLVDIALTQQDIGDMVRLSREATGQELRLLEDKNAIVVAKRSIRVFPEKLMALIAG